MELKGKTDRGIERQSDDSDYRIMKLRRRTGEDSGYDLWPLDNGLTYCGINNR